MQVQCDWTFFSDWVFRKGNMCGRWVFRPIGHSTEGVVLISKGDQWLREGLEPVKHHTHASAFSYNSLLLHGTLILQMQMQMQYPKCWWTQDLILEGHWNQPQARSDTERCHSQSQRHTVVIL